MLTTHNSQLTTALITGVNGFVGKHLASHLASHHRTIVGIDIQKNSPLSQTNYFQADIRDAEALSRICEEAQPKEIFHCAAISHPLRFNENQYSSFQINLLGAISLLEAIRNECPRAVVLMIGSSKQYKNQKAHAPLSEQTPLDPVNFYGISKYFTEVIGRRYGLTYDLDIRYTRSFNHTGPGQSPQFVCSDWARQIALIILKKAPPEINVGNINEVIDFSDVRDVVEAYRLIVEKGKKGEAYNICSNKGVSLKYILEYLIAKSSSAVSVAVTQDKIHTHALNDNELIGDNRKIREDTSWSPKIPIEKTLDDLFEWWLQELRK